MTQWSGTIGANKTGLAYRDEDNKRAEATNSNHKGATAPTYAVSGMMWVDDSSTPFILKHFDGTDWIPLAEINATDNSVHFYHGVAPLKIVNYVADSGSTNAYELLPVPAQSAYVAGLVVTLKPGSNNTGACTIKLNGLPAKSIKLLDGNNPPAGALVTTGVYQLIYDGTNFVLPTPNALPRVQSVTTAATVTPTNQNDMVRVTAQAAALLLANPSGSMAEGQALLVRIKDNGTARAITYDTSYRGVGVILPVTTVAGKWLYMAMVWNATDAKFDVTGVSREA